MNTNAPRLSNPLRFISRLTGNADVDEPRLCVCIEIGQPLLDLMFDLWTGVQAMPRANEVKSWSAMSSYQVTKYTVQQVEGDDQIEVVIHASDGNKWEYGIPFSRSSGRYMFEEIDVIVETAWRWRERHPHGYLAKAST